jgi:hypothetical protein
MNDWYELLWKKLSYKNDSNFNLVMIEDENYWFIP